MAVFAAEVAGEASFFEESESEQVELKAMTQRRERMARRFFFIMRDNNGEGRPEPGRLFGPDRRAEWIDGWL